jgi:hypothetical protein
VLIGLGEIVKRLELRRLPLRGKRVSLALDRLRADGDRAWQRELAALVGGAGLAVAEGRDVVGGVPVARPDGSTLGDVDVLALDRARGLVWALDAKRIAPGLSALSLPDEVEQLQDEVPKHQRRVAWLQGNLAAVAAEFGADAAEAAGWTVRGALVLAAPLAGGFLGVTGLPVLTWPELQARLAQTPDGEVAA